MSKLSEKVQKQFPGYCEEVTALSVEHLEARLVEMAKGLVDTQAAQEADEELQMIREKAKELGEPYRDAKKSIKLRSSYVIELIREKGGK